MKKYILLLLLSIALVACNDDTETVEESQETETGTSENGEAQEEEVNEEEAQEETDNGGFLWKVESGDTEVYMQGTIHVGTEDFYPLHPEIEGAFENADVVLPEINLLEMTMSPDDLIDLAMLEDETTLDDLLSEDAYEQLQVILERYDLEMDMVNHFQPWYVELGFLFQMIVQESTISPNYAVDLYFLERAEAAGKEIRPLESEELQYNMLSDLSLETQIQTLEFMIENFDEEIKNVEQLAQDWLDGNYEALANMTESFDEAGIDDEYWEAINDERNMGMAVQIDEILQEDSGQTYFVFVGTAHVLMEPSIPSILEDMGYEIEHIY
ncbi:TraB/GumN family protein [Alkalihalobacillus trypoxylicola]|uniref:Polysaccharide biosynthesis protein GumN n=1 Tax=Alkalihalobacillus trypoxylicola TaxID=519424 RepID=A0A161QAS6_9BACI|nr:TraB/GumN family protein [Alkalihalobacillus trypoxylicola]KYG34937.1 hypothetical protein AZF04_00980 [Alkalihalobacillus trypoxylicola]